MSDLTRTENRGHTDPDLHHSVHTLERYDHGRQIEEAEEEQPEISSATYTFVTNISPIAIRDGCEVQGEKQDENDRSAEDDPDSMGSEGQVANHEVEALRDIVQPSAKDDNEDGSTSISESFGVVLDRESVFGVCKI